MKSEQRKNKKINRTGSLSNLEKCGSCQYQGMSYHKQLQKTKTGRVFVGWLWKK